MRSCKRQEICIVSTLHVRWERTSSNLVVVKDLNLYDGKLWGGWRGEKRGNRGKQRKIQWSQISKPKSISIKRPMALHTRGRVIGSMSVDCGPLYTCLILLLNSKQKRYKKTNRENKTRKRNNKKMEDTWQHQALKDIIGPAMYRGT